MSGRVKYLPSVFLCLVVLAISLPVAAQDVPMVDVSGGYNYLKGNVPLESLNGGTESISFAQGWYVDLGINTPQPKKMLAIVGQINMQRKKIDGAQANQRGFMGGVRLNVRTIPNMVPFVQFLAGGTNSQFGNGEDGFDEWTVFYTWQLGGGINFMVTPKVGVRVGADFQRIQGKTDSTILKENFNMFRIAAGMVLPFGTR
jgi:opacity protein-like surface antigen